MSFSKIYDGHEPVRINKWLGQSGVCSRREADALIADGLVSVDGAVVTDAGRKLEPGQTLTLTSNSVSSTKGNVPTTVLDHRNDPQAEIGLNEAFVVPSVALEPNTSYLVTLAGQIDGVAFSRRFTMVTEP